jgi:serine/threonine protein kinase
MLGVCLSSEKKSLLLELCEGGNLYNFLHGNQSQRKRRAAAGSTTNLCEHIELRESIAIGIAKGMNRVHQQKICHCDLSSMNILLDESWIPKIAGN